VLAVIPTGSHGAQFGTIIVKLPGIYWLKVSQILRQLVAAGLVEQLESRTATLNGVKYPHYTFRYRISSGMTLPVVGEPGGECPCAGAAR
jgi:hypothetical protein